MRALAAVGAAVGDCAIEPQPELRLKELLRRAAILIKADESELVEGGPCEVQRAIRVMAPSRQPVAETVAETRRRVELMLLLNVLEKEWSRDVGRRRILFPFRDSIKDLSL